MQLISEPEAARSTALLSCGHARGGGEREGPSLSSTSRQFRRRDSRESTQHVFAAAAAGPHQIDQHGARASDVERCGHRDMVRDGERGADDAQLVLEARLQPGGEENTLPMPIATSARRQVLANSEHAMRRPFPFARCSHLTVIQLCRKMLSRRSTWLGPRGASSAREPLVAGRDSSICGGRHARRLRIRAQLLRGVSRMQRKKAEVAVT